MLQACMSDHICDRICEKGHQLQKMISRKSLCCHRKKLRFSYRWHLWSLIYFCMKFKVTTMLPVHNRAVKRRLLKLLSSAWLLVYGRRFLPARASEQGNQCNRVCPYIYIIYSASSLLSTKITNFYHFVIFLCR